MCARLITFAATLVLSSAYVAAFRIRKSWRRCATACQRSRFTGCVSCRTRYGLTTAAIRRTWSRSRFISIGWSRHERSGQIPGADLLPADGGEPARAAGGEGPGHRAAGGQCGRGHAQAHARAWRASRGPRLDPSPIQNKAAGKRYQGLRRAGPRRARAQAGRGREHAAGAQRHRLHAVLVLPAHAARHSSRLVQVAQLPLAHGARAARSTSGVRAEDPTADPDPGARLDRRHALPGAADAPRWYSGLERGAARRAGDARLDDRRRAREGTTQQVSGQIPATGRRSAGRLRGLRRVLTHARPRGELDGAAPCRRAALARPAVAARRGAGAGRGRAAFRSGFRGKCARARGRAGGAMPEERPARGEGIRERSEEHTSELQSLAYLVCRLLLEKK